MIRDGYLLLRHRVAPTPAPGARIVGFRPAGHFGDGKTVRRTEFGRYLDLIGLGLGENAGGASCGRRARQRNIGKFLVLEGQFDPLDLLVRA